MAKKERASGRRFWAEKRWHFAHKISERGQGCNPSGHGEESNPQNCPKVVGGECESCFGALVRKCRTSLLHWCERGFHQCNQGLYWWERLFLDFRTRAPNDLWHSPITTLGQFWVRARWGRKARGAKKECLGIWQTNPWISWQRATWQKCLPSIFREKNHASKQKHRQNTTKKTNCNKTSTQELIPENGFQKPNLRK